MAQRIMVLCGIAAGALISSVATAVDVERITQLADGTGADNSSVITDISADGRYVAFWSHAENLVEDDSGFLSDVFVFDRLTRELELISRGMGGDPALGDSFAPAISADGRYVSYASDAADIVPNDDNEHCDVFRYDRMTGTTIRVSTGFFGAEGNGDSTYSDITADGSLVFFQSAATNLVNGHNLVSDNIFVHRPSDAQTFLVSTNARGVVSNSRCGLPRASSDGTYVVFQSEATNFSDEDPFGDRDIYVKNRSTGELHLASPSLNPSNSYHSERPDITDDGMQIVFESQDDDIVPDEKGNWDIFHFDLRTGIVSMISVSQEGEHGDDRTRSARISGDGAYVCMNSDADNLVEGSPFRSQIYLRNQRTGEMTLVSRNEGGDFGTDDSYNGVLNLDGSILVFDSFADDLTCGDVERVRDSFVVAFDETPSDINHDGMVNTLDLLALLGAWGECPACIEDVSDDCLVDVIDLLQLLGDWTG